VLLQGSDDEERKSTYHYAADSARAKKLYDLVRRLGGEGKLLLVHANTKIMSSVCLGARQALANWKTRARLCHIPAARE